MATTGESICGTGENLARGSSTAWTSPGNITANDGSDAQCSAGGNGSDYLVGRNYTWGTSPGAGDTIDGVTVNVEASEAGSGTETIYVQLQDDSGNLIGTSKSDTVSGGAKSVYTFGGAADSWGASITAAIVNSANFGARVWYEAAHDVAVDYVSAEVAFTASGSNLDIVTADASHAHTAGAPTLTRRRTIQVDNATHAHTAESPTVTIEGAVAAFRQANAALLRFLRM